MRPPVQILYALNVLDLTLQIHTGACWRHVILDVQTVFHGMTYNYEYKLSYFYSSSAYRQWCACCCRQTESYWHFIFSTAVIFLLYTSQEILPSQMLHILANTYSYTPFQYPSVSCATGPLATPSSHFRHFNSTDCRKYKIMVWGCPSLA